MPTNLPAAAPLLAQSRSKKVAVFLMVVVIGFAMFAAPAIFFQLGNAGGYSGSNFAVIGVVQLILVTVVVLLGLRMLGLRFTDIGLMRPQSSDLWLGVAAAATWTLLQFGLIFPATGGAERADISGILEMVDGSWVNVFWYLPLGILGGGVAEEIYNRGFFITLLTDIFGRSSAAAWVAAAVSVLFFAAGHFPSGWVEWIDILIPSAAYAVLFLATGRLTAPIVAHSLWNTVAVAGIYLMYG